MASLNFAGPLTALSPFTPLSDMSATMLRYRLSLEFSPSGAPSQSTALVPYRTEVYAEDTSAHRSDDRTGLAREHTQKASVLQSQLQSLLKIAREANANEEAAASLQTFMQQAKDQQDAMEAVLEKQTAVSEVRTCIIKKN